MITTAFTMAGLMCAGFILVWVKLPRFLRRLVVKGGLLTDIMVSVGAFLAFGATLTAMLAASIVGIMVSVALLGGKVTGGKHGRKQEIEPRSRMGGMATGTL